MNFSCTFHCGLLHSLRTECTKSCASISHSCGAQFPSVSNTSSEFFPACEQWCCEPVYALAIGFLSVLGLLAILVSILFIFIARKCLRKRRNEELMAKASWRPQVTRDAFSVDGPPRYFPEDNGDGAMHADATCSSGAALPPGQGGGPPGDYSYIRRNTGAYDGEISIGFNDEDFVLEEADRADGASWAGSIMSRRVSRAGGREVEELAVRAQRQDWCDDTNSRNLTPRESDVAAGGATGGPAFYLSTTDHRGRPISASQNFRTQAPADVSPAPGASLHHPPSGYLGLGHTPQQRPLSSSRRQTKDSAGGGGGGGGGSSAVSWDLFADVDLSHMDDATPSLVIGESTKHHAAATSNNLVSTSMQRSVGGGVAASHNNSNRANVSAPPVVVSAVPVVVPPIAMPITAPIPPSAAAAGGTGTTTSSNSNFSDWTTMRPPPLPPIQRHSSTLSRSSSSNHQQQQQRRPSQETSYLWDLDVDVDALGQR